MLQSITEQTYIQSTVIVTLTRLRHEWQEATDGNMGLVLADLINGFGLEAQDQCQILGNDLFQEL